MAGGSNPNTISYNTLFPTDTPGSHIPGVGNLGVNSSVLNTPFTTNFGLTGNGTNVNSGVGIEGAGAGGGRAPVPGTPFTANGTSANPLDLSGFGKITGGDKDLPNKLNHLFGGGLGATVLQMLQTGGFSPQDAQAFINAMMPQEARGRESVLNSFGNLGLRDSSAAEIGLGDFESQFASQEMATLAGLREHAIDRSSNLLTNILGTGAASKANETSTWDMISQALGLATGVISGIPALSGIGLPGGGTLGGLLNGGNASTRGSSMTAAPSNYGLTAGGVPLAGTGDEWSGLTQLDPFADFMSTDVGIR